MTTTSPNTAAAHHEENEQVLFRGSPPASSPNSADVPQKTSPTQAPVGTGSKRSSLGVIAPQQPPFSPSPLLLAGDGNGNPMGGGAAINDTSSWDLTDRFKHMQLDSSNNNAANKEAVFPNLNDGSGNAPVVTLAPPADLTSEKQPHSRHTSSGTTSSVGDSPTVPTPSQQKPNSAVDAAKGFGAAADPYGTGAYNDFSGGRVHPGTTHFSPINGNFATLASQSAQQPASSQFGFAFAQPDLASFAALAGTNGTQTYNSAATNGSAAFPPYNSPPGTGYGAAAMMSPGLASPTFLPTGHLSYTSPIIAAQANPYVNFPNAGFELPGSPILGPSQANYSATGTTSIGMGMGRQGGPFTPPPPNQFGRGVRAGQGVTPASAPGGMSRNGSNNGPTTPNRGRGQRGRGGNTGMMSPSAAFPYGPSLSPAPFETAGATGAGAGTSQTSQLFQPQTTNPELASLMLQMAAAGYQQGMMSPYAIGNGGPGFMGGMGGMGMNMFGMDGGDYGMGMGMDGPGSPGRDWQGQMQQNSGPSANNRKLGLYKTELCRSFEEKGECRYGDKCQFAHGDVEQRKVERHPKYKTEICRTFWVSGSCPYGKRCCFIHTELPANGAANGASGGPEGANTPSGQTGTNNANGDTRNRSMSTNSDPNDPPSSLLARISAKAQANRSSDQSPANNTSGNNNPGQPTEAVVAAAINRAMAKFGAPDPSVPVTRKMDVHPTPPPVEVVPAPKVPAVFSNFPLNGSTGSGGLSAGGHHRMSASVDFGRVSRNLGSDLAHPFHGAGHARNPSASSIVTNSLLSRTPNSSHSGQSTPYGNSSTANNGLGSSTITPSSLLDRTWA